MLRRVLGGVGTILMMGAAVACGETGPEVDPAVAAFVGTWDADSLTLTNDADTTVVANLLDTLFAGSFVIVVEPSGQYTATLTALGQAQPEIGQLAALSASTLTLTPSVPAGRPVATATYVFPSDGYLIMDGPTEFDFNLDNIDEAAQVHFELRRR